MKKLLSYILLLAMALSLFAGCGAKKDDKTIVIAASPTPHAEILEIAKEELAKAGYTLEIQKFNDYVVPNTATEDGEVDANYFQHQPYLTTFNAEQGTHLVSVAAIHYEPFGIYAGKTASLSALADGAKIGVPNDATNEARALLLLEQEGLIKLKDGVGLEATKADIVENPHNYDIVEITAELLPASLPDLDIAVINGIYAIDAGLKVSEALAIEAAGGTATEYYQNVIAVVEGNENSEKIQALLKALKSDAVKKFIQDTYDGAVVPLF